MPGPRSSLRAIGCLAAACAAVTRAAGPPDLILHGGRICTVDAAFSVHEALAIADGRIEQVGSDAELFARRGPATTVRDLEGRLVLPGLIDSHVHPATAALDEWDHEIPAFDSIADVLAYVRDRAAALDDGEWIVVRQVFITRLADRRYPTRAELDEAAPRNPVMFSTAPTPASTRPPSPPAASTATSGRPRRAAASSATPPPASRPASSAARPTS